MDTQDNHYLSIKMNDTEYKHFPVDKKVYTYVKQLEAAIRRGDSEKLKQLYPGRFKFPRGHGVL